MFRHKDGNILLCYSGKWLVLLLSTRIYYIHPSLTQTVYIIELAFYIDKKGKRVRKEWSISWEGNPTAFAFRFPYVVAFNTNFIEVRHMDTVSNWVKKDWLNDVLM